MMRRLPVLLTAAGAFASLLSAQGAKCSGVNRDNIAKPVFVATSGTDSPSCGASLQQACHTIQQGIHNCGTGCGGVFVWNGLYRLTAPITLTNGVNLYGSCTSEDVDIPYLTTVIGTSPIFTGSGLNTATTLSGFVAIGADATQPAQASHALTVLDSSSLSLESMTLVSGKGGAGGGGASSNGQGGGTGNYPPNEQAGGPGGSSCPSGPQQSDGAGGQGADYQQVYSHACFVYCYCSNVNYPNSLGRQGHASGTVLGGNGGGRGDTGCGCVHGGDPQDGPPGIHGNPGPCGTAGGQPSTNIVGAFTSTGVWTPSQGGSGDTGKVGSGGGGGGSGGYSAWLGGDFKTHDYEGMPGGGGGGGGCGGIGGTGGFQGGASIPLVIVRSKVSIVATALIPGRGGTGGPGGVGGQGGAGGSGQSGIPGHQNHIDIVWACSGDAPGSGGRGGDGGQGGAGSGGAGGNGGPSFTFALVGTGADLAGPMRQYPSQPGSPGSGTAGGQNASNQCQGGMGFGGVAGSDGGAGSMMVYP